MKILGIGSALPKKVVSNDDLAKLMDTSDEWIRERTGIVNRHIAIDETTTSLSVEAVRRALAAAKVSGEEIDLIIAATVSADHIYPTLSCEVQAAIGAKNATAFDIGAGCSGFLFALGTADGYFHTGRYKKAVILGAETLSKMMDWTDRSTCVLFGDGAGAAVLSAEGNQLKAITQGSNGFEGLVLKCDNRQVSNIFRPLGPQTYSFTEMDGQAVYKFAVRTVPGAIAKVLGDAGMTADEVKLFVLHQANKRIIEAVAKRLGQSMDKFPTNMEKCGNISAASVPTLLDQLLAEGRLQAGDKIVLAGFGAGLTWGACALEW